MPGTNDNVIVTGQDDNYLIMSHYQDDGPTGHFQLMGLAYSDGAGGTWETATEVKGFPVRVPAASVVGGYIQDIHAGLTTASGATALGVDVISSAGLTVNAIVEDLIVGITTDNDNRLMLVCGLSDSTSDVLNGATAVGVTGNVNVTGTDGASVGISGPVEIIGIAGVSGTVETLGTTEIVSGHQFGSVTGVAVHGNSGGAWTEANVVGVTGQVAIDSTSFIGIVGTPDINVPLSTGLTHGMIEDAELQTGLSFEAHGLTSGLRIQAFSTGSSAEYVYVGSGSATGLTTSGYPLREMDSIFIETSDMGSIFMIADNANAQLRYIGS